MIIKGPKKKMESKFLTVVRSNDLDRIQQYLRNDVPNIAELSARIRSLEMILEIY